MALRGRAKIPQDYGSNLARCGAASLHALGMRSLWSPWEPEVEGGVLDATSHASHCPQHGCQEKCVAAETIGEVEAELERLRTACEAEEPRDVRCAKAELCRSLQEETMSSIMGSALHDPSPPACKSCVSVSSSGSREELGRSYRCTARQDPHCHDSLEGARGEGACVAIGDVARLQICRRRHLALPPPALVDGGPVGVSVFSPQGLEHRRTTAESRRFAVAWPMDCSCGCLVGSVLPPRCLCVLRRRRLWV